MKRSNILIAVFGLLVFVGLSSAQTIKVGLKNPSPDREVTEVNFPARDNRALLIFEAVLPASSEADCFASRDFSNAVLVGPERATVVYDAATGLFFLRNSNSAGSTDSCRVLLVRSSVETNDLIVWQARYAATANLLESDDKGTLADVAPAKGQRSMVTSLTVTFNGQSSLP